ncbi:MAG: radical SAM protein, partial [Limisphaerales bacterium]
MLIEQKKIRGRGTAENPSNRFEKLHFEPDPELEPEEQVPPRTQLFHDLSSSILTHNESPDVGFETSLNPYRGCEHGCIYCFARPTHEYLGLSPGLDFETKIMVKKNAPELLRRELSSPEWKPQLVVMSGVTDCYQPIERKLKITRGCLEVFAEFRQPVSIITKNFLVTRDIDLLQELSRSNAVSVNVSVTTLDADLARVME